jgi:hypothetical protein
VSAAALKRYRTLRRELWLARALAPDGKLSQDEEADRVDDLDVCWREMTPEEQELIEQDLKRPELKRPSEATAPQELQEPQHVPQQRNR